MNSAKKITAILGGVIVLFLGYLIISGIVNSNNDEWVAFEPLDAQIELMKRAHTKWFQDRIDIMSSVEGQRVVCDWLMYKSYVASNKELRDEAMEKFEADSMELAQNGGIRTIYWASVAAWEEYSKAFEDEAAKQRLIEVCKDITPELGNYIDAEFAEFKQFAITEELIDENGKFKPEKASRAFLLHRSLWVRGLQMQFPVNVIYPPEEVVTMFRWQIEESHMPANAKIEKILEVANNYPGAYDASYAAAAIYIQSEQYDKACEILTELISSENSGISDEYAKNRNFKAMKHLKKIAPDLCK